MTEKIEPTGTEARVCHDIAMRQRLGLKKYGVSVHDNPLPIRGWLQHLYEEQLDAVIYTKRAIEELDKKAVKITPSPQRLTLLESGRSTLESMLEHAADPRALMEMLKVLDREIDKLHRKQGSNG